MYECAGACISYTPFVFQGCASCPSTTRSRSALCCNASTAGSFCSLAVAVGSWVVDAGGRRASERCAQVIAGNDDNLSASHCPCGGEQVFDTILCMEAF